MVRVVLLREDSAQLFSPSSFPPTHILPSPTLPMSSPEAYAAARQSVDDVHRKDPAQVRLSLTFNSASRDRAPVD